jgi:two-component SAPR family response regulator
MNIPKDQIMEDLWPNVKKETSEANFKATFHRLRKLLEPFLTGTKNSQRS